MSATSTIKLPRLRPPRWAPAWEGKAAGLRVTRILDVTDWLAANGRTLTAVDIDADPALSVEFLAAAAAAIGTGVITVHVAGGQPDGRYAVEYQLTFDNGDQDRIVAWQVIDAAPPAGLVPVQPQQAGGAVATDDYGQTARDDFGQTARADT